MTAEEFHREKLKKAGYTDDFIESKVDRFNTDHKYRFAEDYHKESSKELVEALEECLVSLKGMDKKYTLDKRRIEQAEKALKNHLK